MLSGLLEKFEADGIKVLGKNKLLGALEGHTEWKELFLGYARNRRKYGIVFTPDKALSNPTAVVEKAMLAHGFSDQNVRAFCANVIRN
jgi:phosphoribosylamine-glycine ligase